MEAFDARARARATMSVESGGGGSGSLMGLRVQATDVLSSLVRRSQRGSGSWSAAERQHLAELSASLRDNLELLPLHDDAPANAVTRARARAVVDLVADIGALCRGRTDILEAAETTARLPPPPPLESGMRSGVPLGAALLPPAPSPPTARPAHVAFADRAQSLVQIAAREGWPRDEEQQLQALVASLCETARLLVNSQGSDARTPPSAVARARVRAMETMIGEVAELSQRNAATKHGSQTPRAVDLLRAQANRLAMRTDTKPLRDPVDPWSSNHTARRAVVANSHNFIVESIATRGTIEEQQAAAVESAATANAVRRMSRRHKLAVLRAWRRHVAALLDARLVENAGAEVHAEAEALRRQNDALIQQLRTFESGERDSLARAQAAVSTAESLAEANSSLEASLRNAQAETQAANSARLTVEAEVGSKVRELESQLNDERLAGAAKYEQLERTVAELQRQLEQVQSKSRDEAAAAGKAAEELAGKAAAAEERLLAAQQLACQQSDEYRRKLDSMHHESEQQVAAHRSRELCAQQNALRWQEQAESATRDLEQQCAHAREAHAVVDEERTRILAAEQALADNDAQLNRIARGVREAEETAHQIADIRHAAVLSANDLKDAIAASSDAMKAAAGRAATCSSAVTDVLELRNKLEQHLQLEQTKTRSLESQQAELLATNKALVAEIRELKLQAKIEDKLEQHLQLEQAKNRSLESHQAELLTTNTALTAEIRELKLQAKTEAAAAAERTRELRSQNEQMEAIQITMSELEQQARAADDRSQLAQEEADRMVERIASLAEMKIQEAERQVELARERARVKVEEAERLVLAISEEVEQLSAQDLTLGERDLE